MVTQLSTRPVTQTELPPTPVMRQDDVQAHIEDTFLYSAIRNNKLVYRTWHQLTDSEQREIYCNQFAIY